ncbi:MAG: DNA methylase [Lachnospiraceae bacterium]|nr:DNA methylase [Lachnospiraceae bacterium]
MVEHTYIAIDLKSFYASVECVERDLDPLTTNLTVADSSRTEKTICLAVSPSLKSFGLPGRPRLFEVVQTIRVVNEARRRQLPSHRFSGRSFDATLLSEDPFLEVDYLVAPPRMALYMEYSTRIYEIYLKYIAPEDIHVYSCDEVFMDVTRYLDTYGMSARELAVTMIRDVLTNTGITATAGIGTNLYLCKIAMDIVAKHMPADSDGVRLAELDEASYRRLLWDHRPITDFWRVGGGIAKRLYRMGLYTMGDVAAYSEHCSDALYKEFGVNAELLIDHAWGWEPCTIKEIKEYRPENSSISSGQVLQRPYAHAEAAIIVREMADLLALDLVAKKLVSDQIVLTIGYEALKEDDSYDGEIHTDYYGRPAPVHAHGTANLPIRTSSSRIIAEASVNLYEQITDPKLQVRRVTIAACHVLPESEASFDMDKGSGVSSETACEFEQLTLFTDYERLERERKEMEEKLKKEHSLQLAELAIKGKFGKNAILKGTNLLEGAMTRERNNQIGGHKA